MQTEKCISHHNGIDENLKDECPETIELLQHLFGTEIENGLSLISDLVFDANSKNPILCLTSLENNSGKSSIYTLLQILCPNETEYISNTDLPVKYWYWRLDGIHVYDETHIPKINWRRIRKYNGDSRRFVIVSNIANFPREYSGDFWVISVPPLKEKREIIPGLLNERSAFLKILKHYQS